MKKIAVETDGIYTNTIIQNANGKICNICGNDITTQESEDKQFVYSKTKRGSEIYIHTQCLNQ